MGTKGFIVARLGDERAGGLAVHRQRHDHARAHRAFANVVVELRRRRRERLLGARIGWRQRELAALEPIAHELVVVLDDRVDPIGQRQRARRLAQDRREQRRRIERGAERVRRAIERLQLRDAQPQIARQYSASRLKP